MKTLENFIQETLELTESDFKNEYERLDFLHTKMIDIEVNAWKRKRVVETPKQTLLAKFYLTLLDEAHKIEDKIEPQYIPIR